MKKLSVLLIALLMLFCSACGTTPAGETGNKKTDSATAQYTLALNPSILLSDGTVISARNSIASSIQADMKAQTTTTLYDSTPWQWLIHLDDGTWNRRLVSSVGLWERLNGFYSYSFSGDGSAGLAAYDASKMDIKSNAEMNKSGIIWSFSGEEEEALCYTAPEDCYIQIYDRDGGNVSVVDSILGVGTSFLERSDAKGQIVLRIYKNNRIYWQEVLDASTESVEFPNFTGLDLLAGDVMMVTAQAVDSADGIVRGNCDLPARTATVTDRIPHTETVLVERENPPVTEVPFVKDLAPNFTVVYPQNAPDEIMNIVDAMISEMETRLGIYPTKLADNMLSADADESEMYYLLVGETSRTESQTACAELRAARSNNAADFIVRQTGNKIVLAALNRYSVQYAVDFLFANYCIDDESVMPAGLTYVSSNFNSLKMPKLGGVDLSQYRIVVSSYASYIDVMAADELANNIVKNTGVMLTVTRDKLSGKSGHEILVGGTNRTSASYSNEILPGTENAYTIKVTGDYTYIDGDSATAVSAGSVDLAKRLSKGDLAAGSYSGKYDGGYTLAGGYKLSWGDEFNGNALSDYWGLSDTKRGLNIEGGNYKNTIDCYSVHDGMLEGHTFRIPGTEHDQYVGGISTVDGKKKMYYRYGYAEIRIRLSTQYGVTSSFWSATKNAGFGTGEFDIFEDFGNVYNLKPNLHLWNADGSHEAMIGNDAEVPVNNNSVGINSDEPYGNNFHCIGMEWNEDTIRFFVDGVCTSSWDVSAAKYDIFDVFSDLRIGVMWAPSYMTYPEAYVTEGSMFVDSVHIWQLDGVGAISLPK